ncbi:MAG TPA: Ig-like domain-containing protein, partial [Planctomycetota bacterium]|nr:Ig-like domain-containing protein [Planctomycetota bacterium]
FTNFVQGTTTASFGDGVVVNSVVVQSATSAGVNITIAQSAAVGGRVVTLTTGAEVASLSGGFVIASPPVTVEPDADGDNFPDVVENEVGSNPLDPASTPLTVQPPVTEAVSAPFSLLNTSNLADTADPLLLVGEAVSAPFSLLNTSNLAGTTDPGLFVGEAVTAPFAVLNTTNLDGTTDLAVFVGEAVSPFFVVQNTTTPSGQASSEALSISNARQQSATVGLPRIAITAPAHEQTVFQGQTIDVDVEALGDGLGAAELLVNGTAFSRDGSAPYAFTFIVPGTVTELSLQAAISDARGNRVSRC